ncbi:MAG: DUF58 domain-containing protein [candidate division Zixibacteria bacterium]|nr:DUF58 domain-containing protein [candidate division Zixibacteria bacterium]MCI0596085.1 DUF58 domain-containing protein [candidate division Zixibacteria bacterium]
MIPGEIKEKIRRIEIFSRRLVNEVFSGEYHSTFKGRGMEFEEVREYQPGDDIRLIDWNVTARTGAPFVKKFREERELTLVFLVDASASGRFGTAGKWKSETAAEVCAILSFAAAFNNDKTGLILFTDKIERFVPPAKGKSHVLRLIRELLYSPPQGKKTSLATGLEYVLNALKRKSIVFFVSDFIDSGWERALSVASRKHDVIALVLSDPREEDLPPVGLVALEDAETGERLVVDAASPQFRRIYTSRARAFRANLERTFRRYQTDFIPIQNGRPYLVPLMKFFKERERRFR